MYFQFLLHMLFLWFNPVQPNCCRLEDVVRLEYHWNIVHLEVPTLLLWICLKVFMFQGILSHIDHSYVKFSQFKGTRGVGQICIWFHD